MRHLKIFTLFLFLNLQFSLAQNGRGYNNTSEFKNWRVVNDDVMGGISKSQVYENLEGHIEFSGNVSIDNNGGFDSLRYNCGKITVENNTKIILKIKGDGKKYQLRIRASNKDYFSYTSTFKTSGEWEEISIKLDMMYPSFRGTRLNMENFSQKAIEQISILIGNKKNENFKLIIDSIVLK